MATLTKSYLSKAFSMLKKIAGFLGVLILIIVAFIVYVMMTTGFFRDIDNTFDGEQVKKINIAGAEDFAISYEDKFLIISSDPRRLDSEGHPRNGGLYYMDLNDDQFEPKLLTGNLGKNIYPHGISMIKIDSAKYRLFVINHVPKGGVVALNHLEKDHYIEIFDLNGQVLNHVESKKHPLIKSPNDVVAVDSERFYFTNDHYSDSGFGRFREDYLAWPNTNVVYFNGNDYKIVAEEITYANGINLDKENNILFVASPRSFLTKVYDVNDDGSLAHIEDIDCGTGVDNIEFDQDGKIWIGCHPNLLHFAEYAAGRQEKSPSELITIDYRSKGDYDIETIYLSDGSDMSASTVASVYGKYLFVGNVMDPGFLVLKQH